uniref:Uncharacterized protein n=1 Tax=Rhizophora mucronata TaxID=61149 RepID=A0A2P2PUU9_RHIMU
MCCFFTGHI